MVGGSEVHMFVMIDCYFVRLGLPSVGCQCSVVESPLESKYCRKHIRMVPSTDLFVCSSVPYGIKFPPCCSCLTKQATNYYLVCVCMS